MKEATSEVSGTIIVIVLLAGILAIGSWLFVGEDSKGRQWIENVFNNNIGNAAGTNGAVD